jgi:hypothetical protein
MGRTKEEAPLRLLSPDGRDWTYQGGDDHEYMESDGRVMTLAALKRRYSGLAEIELASESDMERACSAIRNAGADAVRSIAAAVAEVLPDVKAEARENGRGSWEMGSLGCIAELSLPGRADDGAVAVLAALLRRIGLDRRQYVDLALLLAEAVSTVADEGDQHHWRTLVDVGALPGGRHVQDARKAMVVLLGASKYDRWKDDYR